MFLIEHHNSLFIFLCCKFVVKLLLLRFGIVCSPFFSIIYLRILMILAGLPATIAWSRTSCVTTAPAPIMECAHIRLQPGAIIAREPIHTSPQIAKGDRGKSGLLPIGSFGLSKLCPPPKNSTSSPIIKPGRMVMMRLCEQKFLPIPASPNT